MPHDTDRVQITVQRDGWALDFRGSEALSLSDAGRYAAEEILALTAVLVDGVHTLEHETSRTQILQSIQQSIFLIATLAAASIVARREQEIADTQLSGDFDPALIFGEGL